MLIKFYRGILFFLPWFVVAQSEPGLAVMDCALLEGRIEERLRLDRVFVQAEEFARYKAAARKLLAKADGGQTILENKLGDPATRLADLLPRDPLGVAAYFEVFANHRSAHKIEVGRYLTANLSKLPPPLQVPVVRLRRWLDSHAHVAWGGDAIGGGLRVKYQAGRWHRAVENYVDLVYTIEQYARLSSYPSPSVRQKLTEGFLNFLRKTAGLTSQRKLVETELMKDSFDRVALRLGLIERSNMSRELRKIMTKYQNLMSHIFSFVLIGGSSIGAVKLGAPLHWTAVAFGLSANIRARLYIPPRHRARILETVRQRGYEAALREIQPFFRNRIVAEHATAYLRVVFKVAMAALTIQFLNEYGYEIYNGISLAFAYRNVGESELSEAEASLTNEEIRLQILENNILYFAEIFAIEPTTPEYEQLLRSADFVQQTLLPEIIKVICQGESVKGKSLQRDYVLERFAGVLESNDLHPHFISFVGEMIFELWQDIDIDSIRAFTKSSAKPETDFCSEQYRPTIFRGRSARAAISAFR